MVVVVLLMTRLKLNDSKNNFLTVAFYQQKFVLSIHQHYFVATCCNNHIPICNIEYSGGRIGQHESYNPNDFNKRLNQ